MPKTAAPPSTHPATLWQSLKLEWLWVYRGLSPRSLEWSQEISVPAGIFFVETGHVLIEASGQTIRVPAGHAFFSAPGPRRQWFAENPRLLSVGIRSQWPDGLPLFREGLNQEFATKKLSALHRATLELFQTIHPKKRQVTFRDANLPRSLSLRDWTLHSAAFQTWFVCYVQTLHDLGIPATLSPGQRNRPVDEVLRWLNDWPLNKPLVRARLAADIGLTSRRVDQVLEQHLGLSAYTYLERRRLDSAQRTLMESAIPLKQIAFDLGFRHASHFTAWFRRHTHLSPSAYRRGEGLAGA